MTIKELSILAIVAEKPSYGYQIEQKIKQSGLRVWLSLGFSSIYYLLKKLENQRLISSTIEKKQTLPSKVRYTITPNGIDKLQTELIKILSTHHRYHHPIDIALLNLNLLHKPDVLKALIEHQNQLRRRKAFLQQQVGQLEQKESLTLSQVAMYERALALVIAEELWLQGFIKKFQEEN